MAAPKRPVRAAPKAAPAADKATLARLDALEALYRELRTEVRSVAPMAADGFTALLTAIKVDPAQRRQWQGIWSWAQRTQGGTRGSLTDWLEAL